MKSKAPIYTPEKSRDFWKYGFSNRVKLFTREYLNYSNITWILSLILKTHCVLKSNQDAKNCPATGVTHLPRNGMYKYLKPVLEILLSRIWSSAQDHAVLGLILNLGGVFISNRPSWSVEMFCTAVVPVPKGHLGGWSPQNIFTSFIVAGQLFYLFYPLAGDLIGSAIN